MTIPSPIRRLCHRLGIDRAIGFGLLSQGWTIALQPFNLFMLLTFLTQEELGYFVTFSSILSMQYYFDLGMGLAMQQSVSHESAGLRWDNGFLSGDTTAKSRLASLWRLMVRWYAVMAAVFLVVFAVAGWFVFSSQGGRGWQYPWAWTVVATVASFFTLPGLTIVRGTGQVAEAARFQLIQAVVTNLVTWGALACYFGLFSAPLGNSFGLAVLALWLSLRWRPMFADLRRLPRDGPSVDWWREIWPFQWRIALGWPFGFLVYQLFNPVLFRLRGPEEAGRMGISLSVCTVLVGVSMTWINTKLPMFGQFIARREWDGLDAMFWTAFRRSTLIAVACGIAGWLIIAILQERFPRYGDRFLPLGWMALLIVNAVMTHVINSLSAYVRAHRQEPFLSSIIVMGIAMAVMTIACGSLWGYAGMTVGFLILNSLFMIRTAMIFRQFRLAWHAT